MGRMGDGGGMTRKHLCASKVKHPSAGAAKWAMKRAQKSGKVLGECNIYPCKDCGGWHWGRSRGTKLDRASQLLAKIDKAVRRDEAKRRPE